METTEYTQYVEHFDKIFKAYQDVEPYLNMPEPFKSYVQDKKSWLARLKSPEFPVAFLGSFSAGKSTVINAILGKNILPEAVKSSTAIPTHVKKGDEDYAIVHYLGESEKQELKRLYIEEIAKGLGKSTQEIVALAKLDNQELINQLDQDISEMMRDQPPNMPFSKGKFFGELKTLTTKWHEFNGQTKSIKLPDLPKYVTESNENRDILFIDKVEVYLSETNISEQGVVLVDLPGLGVVNPRHKKITESYVQTDAKAFVITTMALKLLEGEEIELLDEIHRQRPEVLQKAFWVINQWDKTSEQQRKEVKVHFDNKVKEHQFDINSERVFKVTALLYLLLKLIENDQLKDCGLEGHLNLLERFVGEVPQSFEKARQLIDSVDEIKDFVKLKDDLLDYLGTTAKKEFLDEAKRACRDLSSKLLDKLKPHYKEPTEGESLKDILIRKETEDRRNQLLNDARNIITQKVREGIIRTVNSEEFVLWTEQTQREFETDMKDKVNDLNRQELKDELMKGEDLSRNLSRLPYTLEAKLPISKMFRQYLQALIQENVINQFSRGLLNDLTDNSSLSETVLNLNDKLGDRDLLARVRGHCDVLLFNYGEIIESLGADMAQKSFSEDKTLDEIIELALNLYEEKMVDFIREQQKTVNDYTKRGVKNYFEELNKALLELFEEKQFEITEAIRKQVVSNPEEELGLALKKQATINKAYQTLAEIKANCQ